MVFLFFSGTVSKTDIMEDGDKKENNSAIHLNEDEQKSGSKNNVQVSWHK